MHVQPDQWVILALAAMIVGVAKTGIPGFGIVAILAVAAIIPARQSTGLMLPMLIAGDIFSVCYYRHHASWPHLLRLAPWAIVGVLVGACALGRLNDTQIRPLIGGIVLALVACNFWLKRHPEHREAFVRSHLLAAAVGVLGGLTTMIANAAGPVMVIYLLAMGLPKNAFLGTSAWFFFCVNLFKVPFSAGLGLITLSSLRFNLILLPAILLGAWLGVRFARRLPEKAFAIVAETLAVVGALVLILH